MYFENSWNKVPLVILNTLHGCYIGRSLVQFTSGYLKISCSPAFSLNNKKQKQKHKVQAHSDFQEPNSWYLSLRSVRKYYNTKVNETFNAKTRYDVISKLLCLEKFC